MTRQKEAANDAIAERRGLSQAASGRRRGKAIAMGQDVHTENPDNRSYQEQFAHSLVASLGWEEAVYACQANTWDGVLEILLQERFQR